MRPAAAIVLVLAVLAGIGGLILRAKARAAAAAATAAPASPSRSAAAKTPGSSSAVSPGSAGASSASVAGPSAAESAPGAASGEPAGAVAEFSVARPAAAAITPATATAGPGEILVRAIDEASGAPVAGVRIAHSVRGQTGQATSTTDALGLARLPFVAAGEHWFDVAHADYTGVAVEGSPSGAIAKRSVARLDDGGSHEVTIRMRAGATLRGTVRDAAGALLARASVHVGKQVARTDDSGAFVLRGLEAGVMPVVVYHDDHAGEARADVAIPTHGDPPAVELRMPPSFTLSGTCIDPEGRGLADATVAIRGGRLRRQVMSHAEGRFRLDGIPPGDYRMQVDCKGYATVVIEKVTVAESGIEGVLVRLEPALAAPKAGAAPVPAAVPASATSTATPAPH
jgi:hypothetical protein